MKNKIYKMLIISLVVAALFPTFIHKSGIPITVSAAPPAREVIRYHNISSVSNMDSLSGVHPSADYNRSAKGESFRCNGSYYLAAAAFQMRREGIPNGYLYAAVYIANVSGRTYGYNANPIEPPIAISEPIEAMTISGAWSPVPWTEFTFIGNNMTLLHNDTIYCVTVNALNGTNWGESSHYMNVATDPDNYFDGNKVSYYLNWWYSSPTQDTQFYVYGYPPCYININTSPNELAFTFNGTTYTSPQNISVLSGTVCEITAPNQNKGLIRVNYYFSEWEDSSTNSSREITVTENTEITAYFTYTDPRSGFYTILPILGAGLGIGMVILMFAIIKSKGENSIQMILIPIIVLFSIVMIYIYLTVMTGL